MRAGQEGKDSLRGLLLPTKSERFLFFLDGITEENGQGVNLGLRVIFILVL